MGRRYGKTLGWGAVALAVANMGGAVGWGVPTYKNARPAWRFFLGAVAGLGRRVGVNKTDMVITFPSGGFIAIYTMDNVDAIRGEALDLFLGDEAPKYRANDFSEVILPTLADRGGRAALFGTPDGLNWFFQESMGTDAKYSVTSSGLAPYGDYQTVPDTINAAFFTAPTSANPMPNIQRAFLLARDRLPKRVFRQEWLAEFVEDGGEVFHGIDGIYIPVVEGGKLPHFYPSFPVAPYRGTFVIAIDWGRVNDWTVVGVMDVHTRRLVDYQRFRDLDWKTQQDRVINLGRRWNVVSGLGELNSMGSPNVEAVQRGGVRIQGFTTTNLTKAAIIEELIVDIENATFGMPKIAEVDAELRAFTQFRLPSGMIRYSGPEGVHDDTVIMLALLNRASKNYGSGQLHTF